MLVSLEYCILIYLCVLLTIDKLYKHISVRAFCCQKFNGKLERWSSDQEGEIMKVCYQRSLVWIHDAKYVLI
jgi:hypothetical protein